MIDKPMKQPDKFSELAREAVAFPKECAHGEETWYCDSCRLDWERGLVDKVAALLRNRLGEGWIPVSERLPESTVVDWVLVYASSNDGDLDPKINVAFYADGEWVGEIADVARVTHWRPLPAPPAAEGGWS